MVAAVESMAYTNDVPWHGLGTHIADAPSVEDMLVKAGLNWKVQKRPLAVASKKDETGWSNFDLPVDEFFALTRDSDSSIFDIVGRQYRPVQNKEAFEFFNEFVEAGKAKMETAGSLRGGKYVWGLANLNQSFKLEGNDRVNGYLLVASPHQSGKSLIIKFTTVRVVCQNTLSLALKGAGNEFRMAHRVEFDDKMRERAKEVLGIARDQMGEFEINARKLKKMKLKMNDVIPILAGIYDPDAIMKELLSDFDGNASPSLKKVMHVYENAPGADVGTGWGVLNAVTYYADHVASRTSDKRMTNAWLGKTAHHKEAALDHLLKLAA